MNRQMLLYAILILAVIVALYVWFGGSLPYAAPQGASQIDAEFAPVLADIARLKTVQLETDIVRSKKFERLTLPQLPAFPDVRTGERNPFLPL